MEHIVFANNNFRGIFFIKVKYNRYTPYYGWLLEKYPQCGYTDVKGYMIATVI